MAETWSGEFYCVKCKEKREAEGEVGPGVVRTQADRFAVGERGFGETILDCVSGSMCSPCLSNAIFSPRLSVSGIP